MQKTPKNKHFVPRKQYDDLAKCVRGLSHYVCIDLLDHEHHGTWAEVHDMLAELVEFERWKLAHPQIANIKPKPLPWWKRLFRRRVEALA